MFLLDSAATTVAVIGAIGTLLAAIITVLGPRLFTRRKTRPSLDIWINDQTQEDGLDDRFKITYEASDEDGSLVIRPRNPYFSALRDGGNIDDYASEFFLYWPKLDFKITNNSQSTLFATRITLQVESSEMDTSPFVLVRTDPTRLFIFEFVNEGWIDASGEMSFRIQNPSLALNYNALLPIKKTVSRFSKSIPISISDELASIGVDTKRISQIYEKMDSLNAARGDFADSYTRLEKQCTDALGSFAGRESALVIGVATFRSLGSDQSVTFQFSAKVPIMPPSGLGGAEPETDSYEVSLDLDRHRYEKVISISHSLKGGEVDRFGLTIGASKSSIHRFTPKIVFNNGIHVAGKPIHLHLLVPRSCAEAGSRTESDEEY